MKKLTIYAVALSGLLIAGNLVSCESKNNDAAHAQTDANDSKEMAKDQNDEKFDDSDIKKDAKFAVNAADGGMLEVEAGKLAQTKGTSKIVKDFGKHLEEGIY
ncbi:MAG: outer membrane protein [Cytophagaceae bacterium]|nr:outer membrane protein [Cytophagaceae bacterium]